MAAFMVAASAAPGMAVPASGPKLAVHIIPHQTGKGVQFCSGVAESTMTACSSFVTEGNLLTPYDLFIVVAQADTLGVSGAQFGIEYNNDTGAGVDFTGGFLLCASGLQFPSTNWPASGEGNAITWNVVTQCGRTQIPPDGIHGTVGGFYMYAYSDDQFKVTEHKKLSTAPVLKVANCSGVEKILIASKVAGWVGFGASEDCNPCNLACDEVPVEATTWGRIKSQYGRELKN
jgi:hypothetical protein